MDTLMDKKTPFDIDEYNKLIGKRLKEAMKLMNLSQTDLRELCRKEGLELSQPSMSRILNGSDRLDSYKIVILCKILKLQPNKLLSLDSNTDINKRSNDFPIITDTADDRFQGYMGKYYGYFYSTENCDTIHKGDFLFYPDKDTGNCLVSFSFDTGKTNVDDEPVNKIFKGTAKLNTKLGAICCEMTSQDKSGDVSYIIFKWHYIANQKCECRIGMVVTICAGLKRLPVAHKLLICREKLTDTDLYFLSGQLKLNDDTLFVSDFDYHYFLKDPMLPDSFKEYGEKEQELFKEKAAKSIYYSFREDDILDNKSLSSVDKVKIVNLLRKYSSSKRCKKVGPKSEDYVFKYLMNKNNSEVKAQEKPAKDSKGNEQ